MQTTTLYNEGEPVQSHSPIIEALPGMVAILASSRTSSGSRRPSRRLPTVPAARSGIAVNEVPTGC